jgi:hypothetical protein
MKFTSYMMCEWASKFPCDSCRVDGVYVCTIYGVNEETYIDTLLQTFKSAFTPALTAEEGIGVSVEEIAVNDALPSPLQITFTVLHKKRWTSLSISALPGLIDVDVIFEKVDEAAIVKERTNILLRVEQSFGFAAPLDDKQQVFCARSPAVSTLLEETYL